MALKEPELHMLTPIMINALRFMVLVAFLILSYSEFVSFDDSTLKNINGEGIGIVLEDFVYEAGEQSNGGTFEISGLENLSGKLVVFGISQFYVAGSNSDRGVNVINNPVNLGRLQYPIILNYVMAMILILILILMIRLYWN
jgi:hypothetical protein